MRPSIDLEVGVPIPPDGRMTRTIYPWNDMRPGDSFFVPLPDGPEGKTRRTSISRLACYTARKLDRYFTTRNVEGGVRVWRVR